MAKPISAKMLATVPASHDDHMICQSFAFQHLQDDLPRPTFAIIILERRAIGEHNGPRVMCRLGIFLGAFEGLEKVVNVRTTCRRSTADCVYLDPRSEMTPSNLFIFQVQFHIDQNLLQRESFAQ